MPKEIQAKTILNKTKRRDPWFLDDYTLNPYSGCSFNCLYCYIRGSKYGEHMQNAISIKSNAPELLEKKLSALAKKGKYGIIVLSSATDPYLQIEKETGLTGKLLEVILKYRFPLHVITKSDLILRDVDLLKDIGRYGILPKDLEGRLNSSLMISFSFSTIDDNISKIFEPGATPPSVRLETMREIIDSGFKSGVSMMPLIPYISDTTESLESMYTEFAKAGVKYLFGSGITLFGNSPVDSKPMMLNAVKKHYPGLINKYEKLFGKSDYLPPHYSKALIIKLTQMNKTFEIPSSLLIG